MNRQSSINRKIGKNIVIDYSIDEVKDAIKKIFDVVHIRYIPEKMGSMIFSVYINSLYMTSSEIMHFVALIFQLFPKREQKYQSIYPIYWYPKTHLIIQH